MAALLDGRLDPAEREALLARLGDDDLAILTDAAEALARESEPSEPGVLPLSSRRRSVPTRWLALAAVLVGLTAIPLLSRGERTPAELLGEAALPAGARTHPWAVTRSGEEVLAPRPRAVRVGVLISELEVAAAQDDPFAAELATQIAGYLEGTPGGSAAAALYRGLAAESRDGSRRRDAREAARALLGPEEVGFGEWLGAARIAATRRDAAFFSSRESRRVLAGDGAGSEYWPGLVAAAGPPPRWGPLEDGIQRVMSQQ